jgi:hypothetical protein
MNYLYKWKILNLYDNESDKFIKNNIFYLYIFKIELFFYFIFKKLTNLISVGNIRQQAVF